MSRALKLSATNLEIGINCWIGAKVEQEGATTVPARLLADFVNSLPPERIDMELITRTQTLNLKCGRFEANIKGIDAQEFPLILVPERGQPRQASTPMRLRQMIDQVAFAAATDESRPVLTGVLAELNGDRLTFAAADGYRLSVRSIALEQAARARRERHHPRARAARAAARQRRGSRADRDAHRTQPQPGLFPHERRRPGLAVGRRAPSRDYRADHPQHANTTHAPSDTADLLKAVRMAFIFARDSANIVRVQMVPNGDGEGIGRVIVSATSAEHGDNVSEMDATVEGAPIEIAFNARYLIDVLERHRHGPGRPWRRAIASSPGVIRPVGGADFVHIIMPMHVAR